ncbi:hypothetical protein CPB84DRAFT_1801846 [Gymnopilus junonius]|uniref:Uncharacterized protein n=1 Tax=Gymnopilus junonius TaxID=109634 RepID=A0A9P5TFQ7_GYMJU|nr:hypothetical protein CPB84DRAFT_1801846 [Gymnopilus junonius]
MDQHLSFGLASIMQSSSLKCLELSRIKSLPTSIFASCINLTDLTLKSVVSGTTQNCDQRHSAPKTVAQLQLLNFRQSVDYLKTLVTARCTNNLPILDFSSLRRLEVDTLSVLDLANAYIVIGITEKLETFECVADNISTGFMGFASAMNPSSFSTLRNLHFAFDA